MDGDDEQRTEAGSQIDGKLGERMMDWEDKYADRWKDGYDRGVSKQILKKGQRDRVLWTNTDEWTIGLTD